MMELSGDKAILLVNPDIWTKEIWEKYYKRVLAMGETMPRLIEFRNAYAFAEKHYPNWGVHAKAIYASYHARNLLDFAVGGVWGKIFSQHMAFFNPRVQGSRRYVMGWRDYPEKMWPHMIWFSIVPAFLASYLMSRADEDTQLEYKKLPTWRRDLFWNIPMPKGSPIRWFTIPKGFESGVIGSIWQRGFDYFLLDDKEAFSRFFLKDALTSLMPFDENSFLSTFQGLLIAIDKKDHFRKKYIVHPDELGTDIRTRHTEQASEFGMALQNASGWLNGLFGEKIKKPFIDARIVDSVIKSYTTYYGGAFLRLYESVFGDKTKDSYYNWDWSITGWFKRQEIYGSIDVQWCMKRMKEMDLFWTSEYQDFNQTITQYFEAPTPQAKQKQGYAVLREAEQLRKMWEGVDWYGKDKVMLPRVVGPQDIDFPDKTIGPK